MNLTKMIKNPNLFFQTINSLYTKLMSCKTNTYYQYQFHKPIILFTYPQLIDKNTHTFVHFVTDLFLYRRSSYSFSLHTWQMANSVLHLTVPADRCDSSRPSYTFYILHKLYPFLNEGIFIISVTDIYYQIY